MKKSLLAVRLYDDTVIFAKEWKQETGRFILKDTKSVKEDDKPIYIKEEISVSNDAIRVWFTVLHGENPKEDVRGGPFKPKNTPAA